jgi:mannose-6-phosphate isomerase-like protein (cupin superfamily)
MSQTKYVFSTTKTVRYRFPTHVNDLIMDRSEADMSEVYLVVVEPGQDTVLHIHDDTEQIFYVQRGAGTLQIGADSPQSYPVKPRDLVRIPPHTFHMVRCEGQKPVVYLCIDFFVGGRPKEEPTWDSHVRALCAQRGWDFDKLRAR